MTMQQDASRARVLRDGAIRAVVAALPFALAMTGFLLPASSEGAERHFELALENGKLAEETQWKAGTQLGLSKRWFPNGNQQSEERWEAGILRARKQWDEKGAPVSDDEFEEDGSRKLRR